MSQNSSKCMSRFNRVHVFKWLALVKTNKEPKGIKIYNKTAKYGLKMDSHNQQMIWTVASFLPVNQFIFKWWRVLNCWISTLESNDESCLQWHVHSRGRDLNGLRCVCRWIIDLNDNAPSVAIEHLNLFRAAFVCVNKVQIRSLGP